MVIKKNEWNVFNTKNSKLPSNKIRDIKVQNNTVWIATSAGLVKYKDNFEVVLSTEKNGIFDDDFISMNIDKEGFVWTGTNTGLYSFKEKIWRVYTTKNSKIPNDHIWSVVVDVENNKWIGTTNGVFVLKEEGWKIYNKKNTPLKSNIIKTINYDDYDRIWLSTEEGIVCFDGKKWKELKVNKAKRAITNFLIDGHDNKWVCTLKALTIHNNEGVEFKKNNHIENNILVFK